MQANNQKIYFPLLIGDFSAFFIVTVIGFLNHNSLNIGRFLATFIPLCLAWLLTAHWFGLLSNQQTKQFMEWWKIIWAIFLCTPLALLIRSAILTSSVQVTFALVMILTSAAAILLWRLIWYFATKRNQRNKTV